MDVFLGTIQGFGFNFAPQGWALCQGQQLAISQNSALFALLGTIYGGNGQTTFALPDLRGRVPIGQGQGNGLQPYSIGEIGGVENATLLITNLPQHTHAATANSTSTSTSTSTLNAEKGAGTAILPAGKILAGAGAGNNIYAALVSGNTTAMADGAVTTATTTTTSTTVTVAPVGGNQPFSVLQPYLCINYAICISGIFPSRN